MIYVDLANEVGPRGFPTNSPICLYSTMPRKLALLELDNRKVQLWIAAVRPHSPM
jgi:hypothetical protein